MRLGPLGPLGRDRLRPHDLHGLKEIAQELDCNRQASSLSTGKDRQDAYPTLAAGERLR
jgi:hypothetical protein